VKVLFCPTLQAFLNSSALWKVPRLRPFVLQVRANMQMKMDMQHWWNDTKIKVKYI